MVLVVVIAAWAWHVLHAPPPDDPAATATEIHVLDGLDVTYRVTPALFDEAGLHPRRDFGVATNGNIVLNADEGVFEIETGDEEVAFAALEDAPALDAMALDGGAVVLGIRNRFFGQLGPEGFDRAFPLPEGTLRLAASSRPGWVYLFRNEPGGSSRLYGIRDDGTMSTLVELGSHIHAVADDLKTTYLATDDGLLAVDTREIRVISGITPDLGPARALAAGPGRLFVAANDRVYAVVDGTFLAVVRGTAPELALVGDRLYCWDQGRRLLFDIDVAPLFADGEET